MNIQKIEDYKMPKFAKNLNKPKDWSEKDWKGFLYIRTKEMLTTHNLAKILLENSDVPVSLDVFGHFYDGLEDACSHGKVKVGWRNGLSRQNKLTIIANCDPKDLINYDLLNIDKYLIKDGWF